MRVSQQMLFSRYIHNLNTSLTSLLDLNTQAQTQKKINKPSDDPTGHDPDSRSSRHLALD